MQTMYSELQTDTHQPFPIKMIQTKASQELYVSKLKGNIGI